MLPRIVLSTLLFCALTGLARPSGSPGTSPSGAAGKGLKVKQLYQFPVGSFLENIAVRANGNIIVTRLDVAEVYEFAAPEFSSPRLIHRFPHASGVGGITEISPQDTFAVIPLNITLVPFITYPGNYSLWTIDLRDRPASYSDTDKNRNNTGIPTNRVKKVTDLPQLSLANGMTFVPEASGGSVLIADSGKGSISKVQLSNGQVSAGIITSSLFREDPMEGINGLKRRGSNLYFTNSNLGLFGRVPFDPRTGRATGPAQNIGVISDKSIYPNNDYNDDLAVDPSGQYAYYAGATSNAVLRTALNAGGGGSGSQQQVQQVIAGRPNSTEIAEPTSMAFGRRSVDRNTLYVVTAGGQGGRVRGNPVIGAQLLAIDLTGQ